ncbi:hypothetical protein NKG94_00050 [Micromonospora sp. M12]
MGGLAKPVRARRLTHDEGRKLQQGNGDVLLRRGTNLDGTLTFDAGVVVCARCGATTRSTSPTPTTTASWTSIRTSPVSGAAPYTQRGSSEFANRYIVGSPWNDTAPTRSSISGTPEETGAAFYGSGSLHVATSSSVARTTRPVPAQTATATNAGGYGRSSSGTPMRLCHLDRLHEPA